MLDVSAMRWWLVVVVVGACAAPTSPTSLVDTALIDPTLVFTDLQLSPARYPVPADELNHVAPPQIAHPQASCDDPLPTSLSPTFSASVDTYSASAVPGDSMCIRSATDDPGHVGLLWQGANDASPTLCGGACDPLVAASAAFPITFQLVGLDDDGGIVRASEPVAVTSLVPTFACNDDPLEPNDSKATAIETGLGPDMPDVTFSGLAICAHGDVDIFHISVPEPRNNKTIAVTATYPGEQLYLELIVDDEHAWAEGPGGETDDGQREAITEFTSPYTGDWWIKVAGRPSFDLANGGPEFSTVDNYDLRIQILDQPIE